MTWTSETINDVRVTVVGDIKAKLLERAVNFLSVSHGIRLSNDPALLLRLQVDDTSEEASLMATYHEIVAEIIRDNPDHALVTMPIEFSVMGKIIA